jgi:hypothetical protein
VRCHGRRVVGLFNANLARAPSLLLRSTPRGCACLSSIFLDFLGILEREGIVKIKMHVHLLNSVAHAIYQTSLTEHADRNMEKTTRVPKKNI